MPPNAAMHACDSAAIERRTLIDMIVPGDENNNGRLEPQLDPIERFGKKTHIARLLSFGDKDVT